MIEFWKPCPEHASYEVSSFGRIRHAGTGMIKATHQNRGYLQVRLGRRTEKVHRLVALAFHGDKRNALHCHVAHLDGDPSNARADNLKWVSRTENESHKYRHGRIAYGERNGRSKLTAEAVDDIREQFSAGVSAPALAMKYGVSRSQAHRVATGGAWSR